jgi:hypothetical protein
MIFSRKGRSDSCRSARWSWDGRSIGADSARVTGYHAPTFIVGTKIVGRNKAQPSPRAAHPLRPGSDACSGNPNANLGAGVRASARAGHVVRHCWPRLFQRRAPHTFPQTPDASALKREQRFRRESASSILQSARPLPRPHTRRVKKKYRRVRAVKNSRHA